MPSAACCRCRLVGSMTRVLRSGCPSRAVLPAGTTALRRWLFLPAVPEVGGCGRSKIIPGHGRLLVERLERVQSGPDPTSSRIKPIDIVLLQRSTPG